MSSDFWAGIRWLAKNPKYPPGSASLALDPRYQPPWPAFFVGSWDQTQVTLLAALPPQPPSAWSLVEVPFCRCSSFIPTSSSTPALEAGVQLPFSMFWAAGLYPRVVYPCPSSTSVTVRMYPDTEWCGGGKVLLGLQFQVTICGSGNQGRTSSS